MPIEDLLPEIFDTKNLPASLYHYTSVEGLKGIIDNRSLWATNYRYLNDSAEIKDMFYSMTEMKIYKEGPLSGVSADELMEKAFRNIEIPNHVVTSFSEQSDDLSMWGRYGNNDKGIAIGFDNISADNWKPQEDMQKPYFGRCIYDRKTKDKLLTRLFKTCTEPIEIITLWTKICAFFKNDSFSGEKEWRLVADCNFKAKKGAGKPSFRVANNRLIPYFNMEMKSVEDFRFSDIVLSPQLSQDLIGIESIEDFLMAKNVKYNSITCSKSTLQ